MDAVTIILSGFVHAIMVPDLLLNIDVGRTRTYDLFGPPNDDSFTLISKTKRSFVVIIHLLKS